jgi:hypothetical protein
LESRREVQVIRYGPNVSREPPFDPKFGCMDRETARALVIREARVSDLPRLAQLHAPRGTRRMA